MRKKVVVLGGGTGMSQLLKGLKEFPVDITAIVSVCDDGKSTGRLRKEFNALAVGDIRKVIVSLSNTDPLMDEIMNYRFKTTSDLDGHTVGNLMLIAMLNLVGNVSDGISSLKQVFNLKGKVLPLTEETVTLVGEMIDGTKVIGEHNLLNNNKQIKKVYYEKEPKVHPEVIKTIKEADLIILSMGSLYTSIISNLICKEVINALDNSKAPISYICNIMTQPGETNHFTVYNHIECLNKYLGKRKINTVFVNDGKIPNHILKKYESMEQKDQVKIDEDILRQNDIMVLKNNYVTIEDERIKHRTDLLALDVYRYIIGDLCHSQDK